MSPAFPLIDISGNPFERGVMYGQQAQERITRSAALYRKRLAMLQIEERLTAELIGRYLPLITEFGAHYVEEMQGMAEGAGLSLDDIVLINARTEIVAQARKREARPDGCTGVIVLPTRSANGQLLHAVNWDWLAACEHTAVVLRIRQEHGPEILTFTEAGGLARSGFNAAGIAITANYLESDRDFTQRGVPLPLIRRKVLEQTHIADAIRVVATTPKACSNNMMLSDARGFAIDFECAPDETFFLYPEDDLLVHANHWVSQVALGKLRDTGISDVPDSFYRDWRMRRLLCRMIGMDDLKQALFDDFGAPFAVCRPPVEESDGNLGATVAMILMEPAGRFMEICPMPALRRAFTRYAL